MSARGWLLAAGVVALGVLAIFLLRDLRRAPALDPVPVARPPVAEATLPAAAPVAPAPSAPIAAPPEVVPPGALPPPPPRSEIPARPPAPPAPPPEFVQQQKVRALSMIGTEIQTLEREQRSAEAAGDTARARDLGVRVARLRARRTALDQELHGAAPE